MVLLCGCLFLGMWSAGPGASPGYSLLLEVLLCRDGARSALSSTPFPLTAWVLCSESSLLERPSLTHRWKLHCSLLLFHFFVILQSSSHHLKCYWLYIE